jgi:arylsulfatase
MLRAPALFDLRTDPFEHRPEESSYYNEWKIRHLLVFVPAQAGVAQFLETFKEFPPHQKPASFTIEQVMQMMMKGIGGSK